MRTDAPCVLHVVAGEDQRPLHLLVRHPPIAAVDVQIVLAVLEKNADGLWLHLAHQCRIIIAAAQTDISADAAEHTTKPIGPFPRRSPRANRPAARAANRAVVWILRQFHAVLCLDEWEQLIDEEPR